MDALAFLILNFDRQHNNYNLESTLNAWKISEMFAEYSQAEVEHAFRGLITDQLLRPSPLGAILPAINSNYILTDKGLKAYNAEVKRRTEQIHADDRQRQLTESVIETNQSVMVTNRSIMDNNASVIQTNESIRHLNQRLAENMPVQNRLTVTNIIVAGLALVVAVGSLWAGIKSSNNDAAIRELQRTNGILQQQAADIRTLLDRQRRQDSVRAAVPPGPAGHH